MQPARAEGLLPLIQRYLDAKRDALVIPHEIGDSIAVAGAERDRRFNARLAEALDRKVRKLWAGQNPLLVCCNSAAGKMT